MIKGADSSRGCDVSQEKADGSSIVAIAITIAVRFDAMQCASVDCTCWWSCFVC